MKLLRYGLLLLVLMMSVSLSLADPTHTFIGTHDENHEEEGQEVFLFNSFVHDRISSEVPTPDFMLISWHDPDGDERKAASHTYRYTGYFEDTFYPTDVEGTWNVIAEEHSKYAAYGFVLSIGSFEVAPLPEFSIATVVFGMVAGLYLLMRRKMVGPLDANR